MEKAGLLVVISAPSGGGKTTVLKKVLEVSDKDFVYSISSTTREKRAGEIHGKDYYYLSIAEFERIKAENGFVEWAEVHGEYYGTPVKPIEQWLNERKLIFLDLDVDGGLAVKNRYGEKALLIFIKPPSFESLIERLKKRNTETESQIKKRMERYPKEMKKAEMYDYQIINEDLQETTKGILSIISKYYQIGNIGGTT